MPGPETLPVTRSLTRKPAFFLHQPPRSDPGGDRPSRRCQTVLSFSDLKMKKKGELLSFFSQNCVVLESRGDSGRDSPTMNADPQNRIFPDQDWTDVTESERQRKHPHQRTKSQKPRYFSVIS
jgi:hypothetical protein